LPQKRALSRYRKRLNQRGKRLAGDAPDSAQIRATVKTRDNGFVPYIPGVLANTVKLDANVNRATRALAGDVVHVYYEIGLDLIGNPSIFFKVVLTDQASRPGKLRDVAQRVALKLMNEVKTDQEGVHAYFNFRSRSEQEKMKDPTWV
jgi:hypothetical protein